MDSMQKEVLDLLKEFAESIGYEHVIWHLGMTVPRRGYERDEWDEGREDVYDSIPAGLYGELPGSCIREKISITSLLVKVHNKAIRNFHSKPGGTL
ncbi:MAG: hypothetical protein O2794_03295 [bacterium]|nr:hypothetical protein [bacterium]